MASEPEPFRDMSPMEIAFRAGQILDEQLLELDQRVATVLFEMRVVKRWKPPEGAVKITHSVFCYRWHASCLAKWVEEILTGQRSADE